jgi:hypothetical protein
MIWKENEYIHNRLTWLGVFQGLSISAVAISFKSNERFLPWIIGLAGISIAISCAISTINSNRAIEELEEIWRKVKKPSDYDALIVGLSTNKQYLNYLMPGKTIPWIFIVFWIICFVFLFVNGF